MASLQARARPRRAETADTLPADERALVDQHLASCNGCDAYLQQMRLTIKAIGHVSEEAITSQTREELLALFRAWRDRRPLP